MLSYQHIYHAGNFADVQKHALLVKLLLFLKQKPQAMCVIDTHAGRGMYDLSSPEAEKTGEHLYGITPVWGACHGKETPLSDYLSMMDMTAEGADLKDYPGSATLISRMLRPTDAFIAVEKHPGEIEELKKNLPPRPKTKILASDGFDALVDFVPPAERRGLAFVDPSYEIKTEYALLPKKLQQAHKKWPQGIFMIWYPMLEAGLHRDMLLHIRKSSVTNILISDVKLDQTIDAAHRMCGSGVLIVNPPFGFEKTMEEITQAVARALPMKAFGDVYWLDNQKIDPDTGLLSA